MDIEKYNQLVEEINYAIDEKRRLHVDNKYVAFSAKFYAVCNNTVTVSPSMSVFKDSQWGYMTITYWDGAGYTWGHEKSKETECFISPEGHLCYDKINLDNICISTSRWENNFVMHTYYYVCTIDGGKVLFNTKGEKPIKDSLNEFVPYIPILQGCRSEEEAEMLIEIKANHQEKNSREEMVDVLMEEIKRLKDKVNEYEKIFDEIRARIPQGKS